MSDDDILTITVRQGDMSTACAATRMVARLLLSKGDPDATETERAFERLTAAVEVGIEAHAHDWERMVHRLPCDCPQCAHVGEVAQWP
jgi:hypothetical protein